MIEQLNNPVWHDVIVKIYKTPEHKRYCQKISKEVKASINHLRTIVKLLKKAKLIEIMPTKKIKRIAMTDKGKRVAASILNIKSELR